VISFIGMRSYAGTSAFLGTYCCNLGSRTWISSNRLHIHGIYALSLSLSLSLCRDDGSDSAADAYHNQLVAGDEEAPDDVP